MRHVIWASLNALYIERSNNTNLKNSKQLFRNIVSSLILPLPVFLLCFSFYSCGVSANYSMTGSTTNAETISIVEFYNNADLGPANMGQTLTNDLKNYFVQNSNLTVVAEEGELQLEGEVTDFRLTPISPTSTGNSEDLTSASSTRLRSEER